MTVTMTNQVKAKMHLSTGAPLPPSLFIYLLNYSFIHLFLFLLIDENFLIKKIIFNFIRYEKKKNLKKKKKVFCDQMINIDIA